MRSGKHSPSLSLVGDGERDGKGESGDGERRGGDGDMEAVFSPFTPCEDVDGNVSTGYG